MSQYDKNKNKNKTKQIRKKILNVLGGVMSF